MSTLAYRPEIDGLRAFAVLGVILHHLGVAHITGGFVGVDVFFVISGYLITNLIVNEYNASGTFSFLHFYKKRVRRLFPALASTIIGCWIFSLFLFSPSQLMEFAFSSAAAITNISNLYFYSVAGYFDDSVYTKPLLHTWSLSVEEQFYLLWPAILIFLLSRFRQQSLLPFLCVTIIVSVVLSEYWLTAYKDKAFYYLPSRMFELSIGALLVLLPSLSSRHKVFRQVLAIFGVALILYSYLFFSEHTLLPGLMSLVPCLGACMVIVSSGGGHSFFIFRTRPALWIGRVSYSLYLVHWPVIVFFYMFFYRMPGNSEKVFLLMLSFALAWLQFRFVESRFRYKSKDKKEHGNPVLVFGLVATSLMFLSGVVYMSDGMQLRIPPARTMASDADARQEMVSRYCDKPNKELNPNLVTCQNYRSKKRSIYIWGDSHALHLVAGISESFPEHNVYVLYENGCVSQSGFAGYIRDMEVKRKTEHCAQRNVDTLEFLAGLPPTNIIVSNAKRSSPEVVVKSNDVIVKHLKGAGHTVNIVGDFIRPGKPLSECLSVPSFILTDEKLKSRCSGVSRIIQGEIEYNRTLSSLLDNFVPIVDVQCPNSKCIFIADAKLLYRDHHHLNVDGSRFFIEKIKNRLLIL